MRDLQKLARVLSVLVFSSVCLAEEANLPFSYSIGDPESPMEIGFDTGSGSPDGVLTEFAVSTSYGYLEGSASYVPDIFLGTVVWTLVEPDGTASKATLSALEYDAQSERMKFELDYGDLGQLVYLGNRDAVRLLSHTISDCGRLARSAIYQSFVEVAFKFHILEIALGGDAERELPAPVRMASAFFKHAAFAPWLLCRSELPAGLCDGMTQYQGSCELCCDIVYIGLGSGLVAACSAAAGAACAGNPICIGAGAAACGTVMVLMHRGCTEGCESKPPKPDNCYTRGGVCRVEGCPCEGGFSPMDGSCAGTLRCCKFGCK